MGGVAFPNPFTTAAGMDKNGTVFHALARLTGAGAVELGAVTKRPQTGNERPRVVRVGRDNLINAMGFPNEGIDALVRAVANGREPLVPLAVQVAKNKDTSDEDAPAEYGELVRSFAGTKSAARGATGRPLPDYFSLNVSSPNTPGLRALQAPEVLRSILDQVGAALDERDDLGPEPRRRLLVKLAPDLDLDALDAVVDLVVSSGVGGLVLTNTTTERPVASRYSSRPGGFSGSALFDRSARLVRRAAEQLPTDRVLIATGGIDTVDRAYEMLRYADLVGAYTGLVLQGPNLFRRLAAGVVARMEAEGVGSLAELRADQRPRPGSGTSTGAR